MLSAVFLASLISGLLLGVYAMLTGVERAPRGTASGTGVSDALPSVPAAPRMRLSPPGAAASATLFGLVGYLLLRYTTLAPVAVIVVAALVAGLGVAASVALVTRWAVPAAAAEPEDPRYLLQGTPARVTRAIGPEADGEVEFAVDGAQYATVARSFDGSALPAGADVAIDRIEDGVAYVEDWAVVEQRL